MVNSRKKIKKHSAKSPKRRRFVEGLIDGKSMRRAAVDAGYSESMAKNAGARIMPGAIAEFQALLSRKIPQSMLVQRIAEGLDARKTKFACFEGDFTDKRSMVDFEARRRYVELACKLMGYLKEKVEISTEDNAPVAFNLQVNFVSTDENGRRLEQPTPDTLEIQESEVTAE
jgi:hypothetical protein